MSQPGWGIAILGSGCDERQDLLYYRLTFRAGRVLFSTSSAATNRGVRGPFTCAEFQCVGFESRQVMLTPPPAPRPPTASTSTMVCECIPRDVGRTTLTCMITTVCRFVARMTRIAPSRGAPNLDHNCRALTLAMPGHELIHCATALPSASNSVNSSRAQWRPINADASAKTAVVSVGPCFPRYRYIDHKPQKNKYIYIERGTCVR